MKDNPIDKLVDKIAGVKEKIDNTKDRIASGVDKVHPGRVADRTKAAIKAKVTLSDWDKCVKFGHKVRKGKCPRCGNKVL